jgi:hypothetical protein
MAVHGLRPYRSSVHAGEFFGEKNDSDQLVTVSGIELFEEFFGRKEVNHMTWKRITWIVAILLAFGLSGDWAIRRTLSQEIKSVPTLRKVDQHFKVVVCPLDDLQNQLRILNAAGIEVDKDKDLTVVGDKFVIITGEASTAAEETNE